MVNVACEHSQDATTTTPNTSKLKKGTQRRIQFMFYLLMFPWFKQGNNSSVKYLMNFTELYTTYGCTKQISVLFIRLSRNRLTKFVIHNWQKTFNKVLMTTMYHYPILHHDIKWLTQFVTSLQLQKETWPCEALAHRYHHNQ